MPTVKEIRIKSKLSQAAFAKTIGVSSVTISAYETNRTNPSKKVAEKIKEVYGAEPTAAAKKTPKAKREKKAAAMKAPAAKAKKEKKTEKRGKKTELPKTAVIIQSPMGGAVTPEEILAKVGPVDTVYIRVDENKAYWVKGEQSGSIDLW